MKNVLFKNIWFSFFSITSVVLIIVSFILPPTGVVDSSVIASVGEVFGFAALATVIYAIDKGTDAKISKGDVTIEIDNPDKE